MKLKDIQYRVCYADTDQMGFVYYGNYGKLFEIARSEVLRNIGISYKSIEDNGVMMPVIKMEVNYHSPAIYDDLLNIKTRIELGGSTRITFFHKIYNEQNKMLISGYVTLCFIDSQSRRPMKMPASMKKLLGDIEK